MMGLPRGLGGNSPVYLCLLAYFLKREAIAAALFKAVLRK